MIKDMPDSLIEASKKVLTEETTHHDLLIQHGFEHKGDGKYTHPEGHEAKVWGDGKYAELKGRTWMQPAPGHSNPKVFKSQIQKLLKQKDRGGPKAGQSAVQNSRGEYFKVPKPLGHIR